MASAQVLSWPTPFCRRDTDAQIDGLIKEFQIELRLDPAKYERDLRVLDQQTQRFGFFPKLEPKAELKK